MRTRARATVSVSVYHTLFGKAREGLRQRGFQEGRSKLALSKSTGWRFFPRRCTRKLLFRQRGAFRSLARKGLDFTLMARVICTSSDNFSELNFASGSARNSSASFSVLAFFFKFTLYVSESFYKYKDRNIWFARPFYSATYSANGRKTCLRTFYYRRCIKSCRYWQFDQGILHSKNAFLVRAEHKGCKCKKIYDGESYIARQKI